MSSAYSSVNLTTTGQDDSSSEEAQSIPTVSNGKPAVPPRPRSISATRNGILIAGSGGGGGGSNNSSNISSIIHNLNQNNNNHTNNNNNNGMSPMGRGSVHKSIGVEAVAVQNVDVDNADCKCSGQLVILQIQNNDSFFSLQ